MSHILHANYGGQNQITLNQPVSEPIPSQWTNYDNIPFYEEAASGLLQNLAILGGLDGCCDMEQIFPHIKNSESILEVGAGYGRVLDYLIRKKYQGEIYAVERGLKFTKILQKKYKNKVNFFHEDLNTFSSKQKFGAILWLWSGISDFLPKEQLQILTKLSQMLLPQGTIILDTLSPSLKTKYSIYNKEQFCIMQVKKTAIKAYAPTNEEIARYAKKIGFKNISQIEYKTTTNRNRILHYLKNVNFDLYETGEYIP